jgi:hypothetical protein
MVWLIRILIIGTFSVAGDRLFSQAALTQHRQPRPAASLTTNPALNPARSLSTPASNFRPVPKLSTDADRSTGYTRSEPTYHPVSMSGSSNRNNNTRQ